MALHYHGMRLEMHPEVYEPAEDSFLLAEALDVRNGDVVLDVGAGTGILALIAAKTASSVIGVDLNPDAVKLARENALLNNVKNVEFRESDLFSAIPGKFDLIVFNPPYLPVSEDGLLARSWSGGIQGLEVVERFLGEAGEHLKQGGRLFLMASSLNDLHAVEELFARYGFSPTIIAEKKIPFEVLYVLSATR